MNKDKKKILFVCQYFYPEVFRGNDIAFHMVKQGHEVHVVTGIPNYPAGKYLLSFQEENKNKMGQSLLNWCIARNQEAIHKL